MLVTVSFAAQLPSLSSGPVLGSWRIIPQIFSQYGDKTHLNPALLVLLFVKSVLDVNNVSVTLQMRR